MDLDTGSDKRHNVMSHLIEVKTSVKQIRDFALIEAEGNARIK